MRASWKPAVALIIVAGCVEPLLARETGCDYWDAQSLDALDARLQKARTDYYSIQEPTAADIDDQQRKRWDYWQSVGQDPAYQMQFEGKCASIHGPSNEIQKADPGSGLNGT